ncbi:MAG: hypothetical protein CME62_12380 [Halobacteriovoraceae bacterium]|nr:hypothetical protein [Halobacteriovoraceae bacterium]|tara:strand:+ start:2093 stop:2503 length:411 start_codon:yes stop_codon:yes gene_type:complete
MEVKLGEIFLYSKHPEKLYHFLSFLLDVEVSFQSQDKIVFIFHSVQFVILASDKKIPKRTSFFSLSVTDAAELLNLKRNIEFFYYKEHLTSFKCEINDQELVFTDPDNRNWLVKIEDNLTRPIQNFEKPTEYVRNC